MDHDPPTWTALPVGLVKVLPDTLEAVSAEGMGSPSALPPERYHGGGPVFTLEKDGWKLRTHLGQGK